MKIRIKGNSIRMRLSKSDVHHLQQTGYLEEQINFGNNQLKYAVQVSRDESQLLRAAFDDKKIIVYASEAFVKNWPGNDVVGLEEKMPLNEGETLNILIEKDFVCLDATSEDQSDNYENPGKFC